ncbi:MAG: hypothetical protein EXR60_01955 [Dehalococcoidia bacterium]|nr:hypothetical protein [Dehalococcoidia bacterium]
MHRLDSGPDSRIVLALLILLALAASACGPRAQEVVGVVVDVEATSLVEASAFTLVTASKARLVFTVKEDIGFSASHLREHMLAGERMKVIYIKDAAGLRALRVEDAP